MKNQIKLLVTTLALVGFQSAYAQVPIGWTDTLAAQGSDNGLNYSSGQFVGPTPGGPGANFWGFGDVADPSQFPASYDELSQTIPTTPGDGYFVSFWVAADALSYLNAYFGSTLGYSVANYGDENWVPVLFPAVATDTSTTLSFFGNNIPAWIGVADVSVVDANGGGNLVDNGTFQVAAVPDAGSTMAMMSLGLVGLGGIARRLRR